MTSKIQKKKIKIKIHQGKMCNYTTLLLCNLKILDEYYLK